VIKFPILRRFRSVCFLGGGYNLYGWTNGGDDCMDS
jgi:hypothetical protein